jgi:hypothetical protein
MCCFRRIPFTIYPEWILAEAKEDRITETSNNLERVEQVQVKRFLTWVEEKILTIEPSNVKRRYELFRAADLDLGPLHVDIVVHRGPIPNGKYSNSHVKLIFEFCHIHVKLLLSIQVLGFLDIAVIVLLCGLILLIMGLQVS